MRRQVSEPQGDVLQRIGIPPRDILAIEAAAAGGKPAYLTLCLATAVAIVALAGLLLMLEGRVALQLKMLRIADRSVIFYDNSWWSSFLILPTVICGVGYAVHVAIRAWPRLEECITAASLLMQTSRAAGKSGRLFLWMTRRTVVCALSKTSPNRTFLQRGNDCTRRVYLILFVLFAIPTIWCLRNDMKAFDLVTPDGIEFATWLHGEPRRGTWRDLKQMTIECSTAGHGNFRLSFTLGIRSEDGEHRISFSETFQPLRKFLRDGELEIAPSSRDWGQKRIERFDMLSDWSKRVASDGVVIERIDGARCKEIVAEGLSRLPAYFKPLAMMLGIAR